jgi:hypothetical protein
VTTGLLLATNSKMSALQPIISQLDIYVSVHHVSVHHVSVHHVSVHHDIFTKMTNKMQLCRIILYSLAALDVSGVIFANHQEHLNCIYSFWYYTRMLLPVGVMDGLELLLTHWLEVIACNDMRE